MESEKKAAARATLVNRACAWFDSRQAKSFLAGKAKDSAQTKHRESEHDLAGAVEEYQKAE
jgi:hypothetical protein